MDKNESFGMDLGQVALNRSNMYHILSMVFQFPTYSLVEELINGKLYSTIESSVQWINSSSGIFNEPLHNLKVLAENKDSIKLEELLQDMKEEYTQLFLNTDNTTISMHETTYLEMSEEQRKINLQSVEKVYREEGLSHIEIIEQPDYLINELYFLECICEKEGEAWLGEKVGVGKKWRRKEWEFTSNHIGKWGEGFFGNVEKSTKLEVYKTLASIGRVYMKLERGY